MSKKKRNFSANFKTKVVLELLSGEKTQAQLASKYGVTPNSLNQWKKKFLENASMAFDVGKATQSFKDEINELKKENDALAKKLGKTTIEKDWAVGKLKSLDSSTKRDLVESKQANSAISLTRRCEIMEINRSNLYYQPRPISAKDLLIMRRIDKVYTDISSTYGYRFMHQQLLEDGFSIGKNKVLKLMNKMGVQAIYPKKRKLTSIKNHEHKIYPYLLKNLEINRPNQVWSGDITYIRVQGGFMYLAAIIDWHSRSILAWKLSNTMDTALVTDALKEAIERYGKPEIFNSDQGSQYTSLKHTGILQAHKIEISMNGKGRSADNIAIERFFRTLKYEEIYINDYRNIKELRRGIDRFMDFYNYNRFHSSLGYKKPMDVYRKKRSKAA
jgi:putative transposase